MAAHTLPGITALPFCVICHSPAEIRLATITARDWQCPRCGVFAMSAAAEKVLAEAALDETARTRLSALVRREAVEEGGLVVFSALMRRWLDEVAAPER